MFFCKYKDSLGEPNKGIHFHFMDIAIIDVIMTVLGAYMLALLFNGSFTCILIILFLMSIILHKLFCVDTTVNLFLAKYFF